MIEKIKYWLFQKGKDCKRCCLRCRYYDICRWDVVNGKQTGKTINMLAMELARKSGKSGVLFKIYEYVAFKQKERRKHEKF